VIALGASAGGLQSCRKLLKALPVEPKMAFVLILHLDPTHESMMVDLLARDTTLSVLEAAESMVIEPGCLYVIPPGAYLSMANGALHLNPPSERHGARLPFDFFLQSLVKDVASRSVCVVLSGTGADGSAGLAAVRAAGGVVIAQDPDDADYPGIPNSAIETGLVDHILTTAHMPPVLADIARNAALVPAAKPAPPVVRAHVELDQDSFNAIVDLVRSRTSQDVTLYKTGTIQRRIAQRMAMSSIPPTDSTRYLDLLRSDSAELDRLAADLLIHVTGFFRDTIAFDRLAASTIPELLQGRPGLGCGMQHWRGSLFHRHAVP
jgi:two-component system CheB/CheR fusion protein